MSCPNCMARKKELVSLQKESKFWKDRYFMEKKSLSCLAQWVLGVFGFSVKVEVDKESLGIRIEGKENKDAMSLAAIPVVTDNKVTLLMEDRIGPEDLVEDPEETAGLSLALSSSSSNGDDEHDAVSVSIPSDNENQQHDAQVILDILRNYEDSNGQQQQQPTYIFLKDGNEGIPVQLDCSQFLQGEFNTDGSKNSTVVIPDNNHQQVVYRFTSPTSVLNATNTEMTSSITEPEAHKKNIGTMKGKLPTKQPLKYCPPQKKTRLIGSGQQDNVNTPVLNTPSVSTDSGNVDKDKLSSDFGLTLREKAEVYVQKEAMKVIQKTSSGSYTCGGCNFGYSFSSVQHALTHTKTHFEGKPYKCPHCDSSFAIQKDFLQHRKIHHSKKPNNLNDPQSPTTIKQSVFLSQRNPNTRIVYPPMVKKTENPSSTAKQQLLSSFGQPGPGNKNKQFKCQIPGCEWSYANANELGWHIKWHDTMNPS